MWESAFFTLYRTLLNLVFKIFKKKTSHLSKVLNRTIWDFLQTHAHICEKQVIIDLKVFKMQHDSSVTLHVSPKTGPKATKPICFLKSGMKPKTEILFWQFFNINIYVQVVGKIPDQHLSVWLFSNPGDKVHILVESMGQICPVVLHIFCTLSPGFENHYKFKCWSGIFPRILTYIIMLENCQNKISLFGCSPIQGTKL